jgi:hypothetical protein
MESTNHVILGQRATKTNQISAQTDAEIIELSAITENQP